MWDSLIELIWTEIMNEPEEIRNLKMIENNLRHSAEKKIKSQSEFFHF